jgi:hypothetical protein
VAVIELLDQDGELAVVHEGESCNVTGQLMMGDTTIAKTALATLTLTLYDAVTESILNSRNAQDILDANESSVDADCNVTIELDAADNDVVDSSKDTGDRELHVAMVTWTWNDGNSTRTGKELMSFLVEKMR